MKIEFILINTLYFLTLINPVSKISVLSVFTEEEQRKQVFAIAFKATLIAILILMISTFAGDFILTKIFKVDLFALKISGGFVLFWVGFSALRKGIFFEHDVSQQFLDISIVPLACPMIAGPATITAVIALTMKVGIIYTIIPVCSAILVNFILMIFSLSIGKLLKKFNLLGALIRLTGLFVMTMGAQMATEGFLMALKTNL